MCWVPYQPSLLHPAHVHLYLALSLSTAAGTGVKSTHPLTTQSKKVSSELPVCQAGASPRPSVITHAHSRVLWAPASGNNGMFTNGATFWFCAWTPSALRELENRKPHVHTKGTLQGRPGVKIRLADLTQEPHLASDLLLPARPPPPTPDVLRAF